MIATEKPKPKRFGIPNFTPWDWLHILGVVLILGAILGVNYGDTGLAISGIPLGSLLLYAYVKWKLAQPKKVVEPKKKEPTWEE